MQKRLTCVALHVPLPKVKGHQYDSAIYFIVNKHVLTSSGCHSFTALPLSLPINSVGYAPSSLSASRSLSRSWSALSLVITQRSTHGQHTVNTRSTHGQHNGQHNGQHDTNMLKNIEVFFYFWQVRPFGPHFFTPSSSLNIN